MSTISPDLGSGWARTNGPPGLRNHVVAFSTVALTDRVTELAAQKVPGTLLLAPRFERGLRERDADLQAKIIDRVVTHPNVGAALVVTHDRAAAAELEKRFAGFSKPVHVRALMAASGMENAIGGFIRSLQDLVVLAAKVERVPLCLSDLTVALECGGSDASSAVCANPAIGRFVDQLIAAGGTAIVSETAEFLGGEKVVEARSKTPEIARRILACLEAEEHLMLETGEDYRGVNPTKENIEAGLTTLTEKTMGALCKIGQSAFAGCLDFAEQPLRPGLHFMDTPFFSPVSLSGMVLAGAQLSLFAMGVFNPSGMPLAPTIKICGNPQTMNSWGSSVDLDVSGLLTGHTNLDDAAATIVKEITALAAGHLTRAEVWEEGQLMMPRTMAAL
jgi:altronate dehydratase large subunit